MQEHEMYYANLSWPKVERLLASDRKTVLLLPVGSTEPHGPHSPLCTDPLISAGMCRRAVERLAADPELGALILPTVAYGVTRYTQGFGGVIHISEETLHALLTDICSALIDKGHPYIVLVNNHFEPEHVQTLHRVVRTVHERKGVLVGYLDLTRKERARALTEEFWKGECHAGRYETSLVLADHPELVDREVMAKLPYVPVNLVQVIGQGLKEFRQMGLEQAYNGSPAEATAAEGEAIFDTLTEMLIHLMKDLVRGQGGSDAPGFYVSV